MSSGIPSLQERITQKISEIAAIADAMPGVVIIHSTTDFSIRYMSQRGLDILDVSLEELITMGPEYHSRFFNAEQILRQLPKLTAMLQSGNDSEAVSVFQEVRRSPDHPWNLYCTSLKVLLRDDDGTPVLTLCIAIPIDPDHHLAGNVSQLLEQIDFYERNSCLFAILSKRERIVLGHLAQGKTSAAISEELHLSPLTVDTYRRNIKQKLGVRTQQELWQFSRVFGLL